MASTRSIRKDRQKRMEMAPFYRRIFETQLMFAEKIGKTVLYLAKAFEESLTRLGLPHQPQGKTDDRKGV